MFKFYFSVSIKFCENTQNNILCCNTILEAVGIIYYIIDSIPDLQKFLNFFMEI